MSINSDQDNWKDVLSSQRQQSDSEWAGVVGTPQKPVISRKQWDQVSSTDDPISNRIAAIYKQFTDVLQPYGFHATEEKVTFSNFWNDDPNIGYKIHLNVVPHNVVRVSDFLKSQGYEHKYLSGGDVDEGKVFTVYTGSKQTTEQYVQEIYDGIGRLLEEPKDHGEVEYAPRIVGRFVGAKSDGFRQYGKEGIALLYAFQGVSIGNTNREYLLERIREAQQKAWELYGEYYGGGITPYKPE